MDKEGLKLAALYSYKCLRSEKQGFDKMLLEFIKSNKNPEIAVRYLKKLNSYSFYSIIASRKKITDCFTKEVVESYWEGNEHTELITKDGRVLFLFHNFTVLEFAKEPDKCKISVAQVKKIKDGKIIVDHLPVILRNNKFCLADNPEEEEIEKGFVFKAKKGDWITYHRGIGRRKVEEQKAISLLCKTRQAIELFNNK